MREVFHRFRVLVDIGTWHDGKHIYVFIAAIIERSFRYRIQYSIERIIHTQTGDQYEPCITES